MQTVKENKYESTVDQEHSEPMMSHALGVETGSRQMLL